MLKYIYMLFCIQISETLQLRNLANYNILPKNFIFQQTIFLSAKKMQRRKHLHKSKKPNNIVEI